LVWYGKGVDLNMCLVAPRELNSSLSFSVCV
jgi:hypothetical protein